MGRINYYVAYLLMWPLQLLAVEIANNAINSSKHMTSFFCSLFRFECGWSINYLSKCF